MGGFVNKRALEIWDIVTRNIDFQGSVVVDIGCGPADFARLAFNSGAKYVTGIDLDYAILLDGSAALKEDKREVITDFMLLCNDIDDLVAENDLTFAADIALCFSCLPYLNDFNSSLEWISRMGQECSLIEGQYYGGDNDMENLLALYWGSVEKIGETDTSRSIWLCQG